MTDTAPGERDPARVVVTRESGDLVRLSFAGRWTIGERIPALAHVMAQLDEAAGQAQPRLALDGRAIVTWDSQYLVFLHKLCSALQQRQIAVDATALPEGARRLLTLAKTLPGAPRRPIPVEPETWSLRVGHGAHGLWDAASAFSDFLGRIAFALARLLARRARFPIADFLVQVQNAGVKALPIVSLIAVLVGLIIAFVGSVQLRRFGAGVFTADMVAIAMLREMGALMTAVIMAGRTGAAFAAELATMQVNEEVDALATLGIDPVEYLVLPRLFALSLMMPLLCLYADLMGIIGGAIVGVTVLDIPLFEYWTRTRNALGFTNLGIGLAKAFVFGGLIALAGCLRGLAAGRSAAAVGQATTSAVVLAIVLLVVADGIFAVILNVLGI